MESPDYKKELRTHYDHRDVDAIIRLVSELIKAPQFAALSRRLIKEGRITSAAIKAEDVAAALIEELEEEIEQSGDIIVQDNYFEIAEQLKKRFNDEVAEVYLSTKIPNEFLHKIRLSHDRGDTGRLSENLVNQYKNELIRIEDGRRVVVKILQQHSNFPIENVKALSDILKQLHLKLKSNYSYLSIKPYFLGVFEAGQGSLASAASGKEADQEISSYALFPHYLTTGQEPDLGQQVKFRIQLVKLLQFLWKRKILPVAEHKQVLARVSDIFNYRGEAGLSTKARKFLEDLNIEINNDQEAILKRLAQTFVDEYRCAEQQMGVRHGMIEAELAYTKEYLKQLESTGAERSTEEEEKIRIALEKVVNLQGIFEISPVRAQAAANKPFHELERAALGISTAINASQITDWIRIYSILFSNSEFLKYSKEAVDFSIMRRYISNLTTYHLILSVSELKLIVDRSLKAPSDNRPDHFKQFGEVLKLKLQGLISSRKDEEKSFQEMIQELSFLQDDATQFVIAETFKGFQAIADAFNDTIKDYFVRDREALLQESRELYSQICAQCLKNVVVRPARRELRKTAVEAGKKGKSWLSRLFS